MPRSVSYTHLADGYCVSVDDDDRDVTLFDVFSLFDTYSFVIISSLSVMEERFFIVKSTPYETTTTLYVLPLAGALAKLTVKALVLVLTISTITSS